MWWCEVESHPTLRVLSNTLTVSSSISTIAREYAGRLLAPHDDHTSPNKEEADLVLSTFKEIQSHVKGSSETHYSLMKLAAAEEFPAKQHVLRKLIGDHDADGRLSSLLVSQSALQKALSVFMKRSSRPNRVEVSANAANVSLIPGPVDSTPNSVSDSASSADSTRGTAESSFSLFSVSGSHLTYRCELKEQFLEWDSLNLDLQQFSSSTWTVSRATPLLRSRSTLVSVGSETTKSTDPKGDAQRANVSYSRGGSGSTTSVSVSAPSFSVYAKCSARVSETRLLHLILSEFKEARVSASIDRFTVHGMRSAVPVGDLELDSLSICHQASSHKVSASRVRLIDTSLATTAYSKVITLSPHGKLGKVDATSSDDTLNDSGRENGDIALKLIVTWGAEERPTISADIANLNLVYLARFHKEFDLFTAALGRTLFPNFGGNWASVADLRFTVESVQVEVPRSSYSSSRLILSTNTLVASHFSSDEGTKIEAAIGPTTIFESSHDTAPPQHQSLNVHSEHPSGQTSFTIGASSFSLSPGEQRTNSSKDHTAPIATAAASLVVGDVGGTISFPLLLLAVAISRENLAEEPQAMFPSSLGRAFMLLHHSHQPTRLRYYYPSNREMWVDEVGTSTSSSLDGSDESGKQTNLSISLAQVCVSLQDNSSQHESYQTVTPFVVHINELALSALYGGSCLHPSHYTLEASVGRVLINSHEDEDADGAVIYLNVPAGRTDGPNQNDALHALRICSELVLDRSSHVVQIDVHDMNWNITRNLLSMATTLIDRAASLRRGTASSTPTHGGELFNRSQRKSNNANLHVEDSESRIISKILTSHSGLIALDGLASASDPSSGKDNPQLIYRVPPHMLHPDTPPRPSSPFQVSLHMNNSTVLVELPSSIDNETPLSVRVKWSFNSNATLMPNDSYQGHYTFSGVQVSLVEDVKHPASLQSTSSASNLLLVDNDDSGDVDGDASDNTALPLHSLKETEIIPPLTICVEHALSPSNLIHGSLRQRIAIKTTQVESFLSFSHVHRLHRLLHSQTMGPVDNSSTAHTRQRGPSTFFPWFWPSWIPTVTFDDVSTYGDSVTDLAMEDFGLTLVNDLTAFPVGSLRFRCYVPLLNDGPSLVLSPDQDSVHSSGFHTKTVSFGSRFQLDSSIHFSLDYFNTKYAAWEPLIEHTSVSTTIAKDLASPLHPMSVNISIQCKPIELTVCSQSLSDLSTLLRPLQSPGSPGSVQQPSSSLPTPSALLSSRCDTSNLKQIVENGSTVVVRNHTQFRVCISSGIVGKGRDQKDAEDTELISVEAAEVGVGGIVLDAVDHTKSDESRWEHRFHRGGIRFVSISPFDDEEGVSFEPISFDIHLLHIQRSLLAPIGAPQSTRAKYASSSLMLRTSIDAGAIVLDISSPFKLANEAGSSFDILLFEDAVVHELPDSVSAYLPAVPPLGSRRTQEIKVRPSDSFRWSTPLAINYTRQERTSGWSILRCESLNSKVPDCFVSASIHEVDTTGSGLFELKLAPAVSVTNLLPLEIESRITQLGSPPRRISLDPNECQSLLSVSPAANLTLSVWLHLRNENGVEVVVEGSVKLPVGIDSNTEAQLPEPIRLPLTMNGGGTGLQIAVEVSFSAPSGCMMVSVYSPVVVVNHMGKPIHLRIGQTWGVTAEGSGGRSVLGGQLPVPTNSLDADSHRARIDVEKRDAEISDGATQKQPNRTSPTPSLSVYFRTEKFKWSTSPVDVQRIDVSTYVNLIEDKFGDHGQQTLAVSVLPGDGVHFRSAFVTVRPSTTLVNNFPFGLRVRQCGVVDESKETVLQPGERTVWTWPDAEKLKLISALPKEWTSKGWSGYFGVEQVSDTAIRLREREARPLHTTTTERFLRVQVLVQNDATVVHIGPHDRASLPLRVENRCVTETVRFRQSGEKSGWIELAPYTSMPFAWEEPTHARSLDAEVVGTPASCSLDLTSSVAMELDYQTSQMRKKKNTTVLSKMFIYSTWDGPATVIVFSDHPNTDDIEDDSQLVRALETQCTQLEQGHMRLLTDIARTNSLLRQEEEKREEARLEHAAASDGPIASPVVSPSSKGTPGTPKSRSSKRPPDVDDDKSELRVQVIAGRDLPAKNTYCRVLVPELSDEAQLTDVVYKSTSPAWYSADLVFDTTYLQGNAIVVVRLVEKNGFWADRVLGECRVPLLPNLEGCEPVEKWYSLMSEKGQGKVQGQLHIRMWWIPSKEDLSVSRSRIEAIRSEVVDTTRVAAMVQQHLNYLQHRLGALRHVKRPAKSDRRTRSAAAVSAHSPAAMASFVETKRLQAAPREEASSDVVVYIHHVRGVLDAASRTTPSSSPDGTLFTERIYCTVRRGDSSGSATYGAVKEEEMRDSGTAMMLLYEDGYASSSAHSEPFRFVIPDHLFALILNEDEDDLDSQNLILSLYCERIPKCPPSQPRLPSSPSKKGDVINANTKDSNVSLPGAFEWAGPSLINLGNAVLPLSGLTVAAFPKHIPIVMNEKMHAAFKDEIMQHKRWYPVAQVGKRKVVVEELIPGSMAVSASVFRFQSPVFEERPEQSWRLSIPRFGVSLIGEQRSHSRAEVCYASIHNAVLSLLESGSSQMVEAAVDSVQVDNQSRGVRFPVIFGPSPHLDEDVQQPLIQLSLNRNKEGHFENASSFFLCDREVLQNSKYELDFADMPALNIKRVGRTSLDDSFHFRYASLLIQKCCLNIDEDELAPILSVWTPFGYDWELLRYICLGEGEEGTSCVDNSAPQSEEPTTDVPECSRKVFFKFLQVQSVAVAIKYICSSQPERVSLLSTAALPRAGRIVQTLLRYTVPDGGIKPTTTNSAVKGSAKREHTLKINSLTITDGFASPQVMLSSLERHTLVSVVDEVLSLGSVSHNEHRSEVARLVSSLGSGVAEFYYEPHLGIVQCPRSFAKGLAKRSITRVHDLFGQLFESSSSRPSDGSDANHIMQMHDKYIASYAARQQSLKLVSGFRKLGFGVLSKLTPTKGGRKRHSITSRTPVKAWQKRLQDGEKGFLGVQSHPSYGHTNVLCPSHDSFHTTIEMDEQRIGSVNRVGSALARCRAPRHISKVDPELHPYNVSLAMGRLALETVSPPMSIEAESEELQVCVRIGSSHVLIVSDVRWLCLRLEIGTAAFVLESIHQLDGCVLFQELDADVYRVTHDDNQITFHCNEQLYTIQCFTEDEAASLVRRLSLHIEESRQIR